jgi:hypothetical protein
VGQMGYGWVRLITESGVVVLIKHTLVESPVSIFFNHLRPVVSGVSAVHTPDFERVLADGPSSFAVSLVTVTWQQTSAILEIHFSCARLG